MIHSMQSFNLEKKHQVQFLILAVCSIKTKTLANNNLKTTPTARWVASACEKGLKTFSSEIIKVLDKIATTVVYNKRMCEDACLIVEDGHRNVIAMDLFSSLGLAVIRQQAQRVKVLTTYNLKQPIASQFLDLVSRICLTKTHIFKSKFHQVYSKALKRSSRSH